MPIILVFRIAVGKGACTLIKSYWIELTADENTWLAKITAIANPHKQCENGSPLR
ncbi:MAG TPA: hypothetical protein VJK29_19180 [Terriglobales bacterium]|nr:hypothetical protein [Terriglobales bacterium]